MLPPEALPDRAVLRVDRPQPVVGLGHDELAGHHQDLFGRQADDLAGAQRGQRRRQRSRSRDGRDHQVAVRVRDHLLDPRRGVGIAGLDRVAGGAGQRAAARQQAEDLEAVRVAVDDVERLGADRPRRAQDRHPLAAHLKRPPSRA